MKTTKRITDVETFVARLAGYTSGDWANVEVADAAAWDAAWEAVLALGGLLAANRAMAVAADAGADLRRRAYAGAAAGALAVRGRIPESRLRPLLDPFGIDLRTGTETERHGLVARLAAHCPLVRA
jgi:hypothetical protein